MKKKIQFIIFVVLFVSGWHLSIRANNLGSPQTNTLSPVITGHLMLYTDLVKTKKYSQEILGMSNDGKKILIGSRSLTWRISSLIDTPSNQLLHSWESRVIDALFSKSGNKLIFQFDECKNYIINTKDGSTISIIDGCKELHPFGIGFSGSAYSPVKISDNGDRIAAVEKSSGRSFAPLLLDGKGNVLKYFEPSRGINLSQNGNLFFSAEGHPEQLLHLFDTKKLKTIATWKNKIIPPGDNMYSFLRPYRYNMADNGNLLYISLEENNKYKGNLIEIETLKTIWTWDDAVIGNLNTKGDRILIQFLNNDGILFETNTKKIINKWPNIKEVLLSPDGKTLFLLQNNSGILVNTINGKEIAKLSEIKIENNKLIDYVSLGGDKAFIIQKNHEGLLIDTKNGDTIAKWIGATGKLSTDGTKLALRYNTKSYFCDLNYIDSLNNFNSQQIAILNTFAHSIIENGKLRLSNQHSDLIIKPTTLTNEQINVFKTLPNQIQEALKPYHKKSSMLNNLFSNVYKTLFGEN